MSVRFIAELLPPAQPIIPNNKSPSIGQQYPRIIKPLHSA